MKQIKITVRGEVQGIFFRSFVHEEALRLKLKGYVRNTDKGAVEVVAQGRDEQLKELVERCKQGPKAARVDKVEVKEERVSDFDGFEIRY